MANKQKQPKKTSNKTSGTRAKTKKTSRNRQSKKVYSKKTKNNTKNKKTTTKKSNYDDEFIMVCPKCKSPDVAIDKTNPLQPSFGLPPKYICNKCGYSGYNFPEIKLSNLEGFEKEMYKKHLIKRKTNKELVDVSYGNFEVRAIWKITGPLLFLVGLFVFSISLLVGAIIILLSLFMIYTTYYKKKGLRQK